MSITRLAEIAVWCLAGGSTDFYPCIYLCRIRYFFPGVSRVRSLQRAVQKDTDTSNIEDFTVPFSSLDFFTVPY